MGLIGKIKQGLAKGKRNNHTKSKAQGMVEFALILPLLLLLLIGVFEFGRMLFVYAATFTSSREAARYASAVGYGENGFPRYKDCGGIEQAALRIGSIIGISNDDIVISYDNGPGTGVFDVCHPGVTITGEGNRVEVSVRTVFRTLVPLLNIPDIDIESTSRRTIFKDIQVID